MEDIIELFIPIIMFASIPIIVWIVAYYRNKTRQAQLDTLVAFKDSDKVITPELIASLNTAPKQPKHSDLRRGVILIAAGVALFMFGQFSGEADAEAPLRAIAAFPLFIGLAYTGLWVFISRKED